MVQLRFEPGFADPQWCSRSHVLIVLEGELAVEFRDHVVWVGAGDALKVDAGTEHRAKNHGKTPRVLFAVCDMP